MCQPFRTGMERQSTRHPFRKKEEVLLPQSKHWGPGNGGSFLRFSEANKKTFPVSLHKDLQWLMTLWQLWRVIHHRQVYWQKKYSKNVSVMEAARMCHLTSGFLTINILSKLKKTYSVNPFRMKKGNQSQSEKRGVTCSRKLPILIVLTLWLDPTHSWVDDL